MALGGHRAPNLSAEDAARTTERYYFSQGVKAETRAESIAQACAGTAGRPPRPAIVHFNGAFHSDYGLGTAARVIRRLPDARVRVISVRPVGDLDALAPSDDERRLGNFVLYTTRTGSVLGPGFQVQGPSRVLSRPGS
jgi:hypothetical protein